MTTGLIGARHIGPLLRLGPARSDHHRDLGDAELPGGEHPGVARDQATVLAHQRRVVQPHSLMLAAMAATWASVWVRAFFAYGISLSIAQRSTLSAGHGF
jgi:hypothetical protein